MFFILLDRAPPQTLDAVLEQTLTPRLEHARKTRHASTRQRYLEAGYRPEQADQMTALAAGREPDVVVVKQLKAKGPWAVCVAAVEDPTADAPGLEFVEETAAALAQESGRSVWVVLDRPFDLRAASLDARGKRRWAAPEDGEAPEYSKAPLKRVAQELKVSLRAVAALRLESERALPTGLPVREAPRLWKVLTASGASERGR